MKCLILFCAIALVKSSVIPVTGVTVGLTPYSHPIHSLYHSQDNYGQYVYGYSTPTSTKTETKTADGVTQGGYSYIDSHGHLQTVQYVADPVHGFRVAATNLPQDLPEVAYAKAKHLYDYAAIKSEHAAAHAVAYSNPIAVPLHAVPKTVVLPQPVQDLPEVAKARAQHLSTLNAAYAAHEAGVHQPQVVQDLPEVVKARNEHLRAFEAVRSRDAAASFSPIPEHFTGTIVPVRTVYGSAPAPVIHTAQVSYSPLDSQYHSQDNYGQYSYGYVSPLSTKSETRSADGVTRGGYSYIDAHGVVQTVHYVADAVHGFRVAATNLPVDANSHVVDAPLAPLVAPVADHYSQHLVY